MIQLNPRTTDNTTANGNGTPRTLPDSSPQARIQRAFDGVVASYIRDISVRTAAGARQQ